MTATHVLSANIKVTLPTDAAKAALRGALFDTDPDIAGLQEWGPNRDEALDQLARWGGYSWTRPASGTGPIMWDKERYRFITSRARVLTRSGFMGVMPGRRSTLPASLAALVVLEDDETGDEVAVLNIHLTAEVQDRYGNYHRDPEHKARVRRHKREVASIRRIARNQRRKGRTVYVVGDTNFDGLTIKGLISCWVGRKGATLGNRAVDAILTNRFPVEVDTIKTASDHRAVAAVYRDNGNR